MRYLIAIVLLLSFASCNTIEGVGRDISTGGQVIEDAASDVKRRVQQPVVSSPPIQQSPIYVDPIYTPPPSTNSQYIY